jgi:ABC-2 type transport system ATP-binding protein
MNTPTTGQHAIQIDHLVYDYPQGRALNDVSFAIPQGSITALVGPNGAGKTTLLRCLTALTQPFSGQVLLQGIDTAVDPRACHRLLGYVADSFGVYKELTIAQCLRHAGAIQQVPEEGLGERIQQLVSSLQLPSLTTMAGVLSRGQRQRLALAQAIIHQPSILVLDEPASGLDPDARLLLADVLQALRTTGMTIIVSSHILAELEEYSTHMLVMSAGQVQAHVPLGNAAALHSTTDSSADLPPKQRLSLRLATPDDRVLGVLAAEAEVSAAVLNISGVEVQFDWAGDPAGRSSLLWRLLAQDLPVIGLSEHGTSLQQLYRDLTRQPGASRP